MMTTEENPKALPFIGKDGDSEERGFFNRPRAGGKTMWDWLNLLGILAIPLVVAIATIGFGLLQLHLADVQHAQDQANALDQQQATLLQAYMDNIQDLMLNHNLLKSSSFDTKNPYYDVAILARARTMATAKNLYPIRKSILLNFLYEAKLIEKGDEKIDLSLVDMSGVKITGIDLHGADLHGIGFKNADLRYINLSDTDLHFVDLRGTDLIGANLRGANLTGTRITQQQLDQFDRCTGAILPSQVTCRTN